MEMAGNRKELEQVEDEAARMATRQPQEWEKQKVKQQGEIVAVKESTQKIRTIECFFHRCQNIKMAL